MENKKIKKNKITQIGDYSLQEKIGSGRSAKVWRVIDKRLNSINAAKVLTLKLFDIDEKKSFDNEIKIYFLIHSLQDERRDYFCELIKYFIHFDTSGINAAGLFESTLKFCIVLPEYKDLLEFLDENRQWPIIADIIKQLIAAVSYLHELNIIHTDIKPGNIVICPANKTIKLIDFGHSHTGYFQNNKIGTYGYISPEQIIFNAHDKTIDIWAMMCTVYEIITDERIFFVDEDLYPEAKGRTAEIFEWHMHRDYLRQFWEILGKAPEKYLAAKKYYNGECINGFDDEDIGFIVLGDAMAKQEIFQNLFKTAKTDKNWAAVIARFLFLGLTYEPEDRKSAAELRDIWNEIIN